MILTKRLAEWIVVGFFMALVVIVFQQIATSMIEQGIASGSPYDNGASYPRAVAITIILLLLPVVLFGGFLRSGPNTSDNCIAVSEIRRPASLLVIFAIYLWALGTLGYHISTPLMMMAIIFLSGVRRWIEIVLVASTISLVLAFLFEVFLKIVLPGGAFNLHIAW
jgi:putative tricarboxylic transport membrane protein